MRELARGQSKVYRLVCRLCKVVYISSHDFAPTEGLHCFCGEPLSEYVSEDHNLYERIPLTRKALVKLPRKEVRSHAAKT